LLLQGHGLDFVEQFILLLVGFSDANFAGCGIDHESTFDTCHFLRSFLFAGLLKNNLQLFNSPQRLNM
jgi:hypothetical protein